jgi:gamma-glutamyltranspeptidase/glutathione hydrolase
MAPAIDYAANGYRILPADAARLASARDEAIEFPGTAAIYYKPDGTPYHAGDLLRQPDHARTLRTIASGGRDVFYDGPIADAMAADLAAHGSVVTREAIADYEAEDSRIVRGTYRGYDLIGMDIPAAGALTIQALQILENFEPSEMSEAEWFALVGQAVSIARGELAVLGTDTAAARATSKEWAAKKAAEMSVPAVAGSGRPVPAPFPAADDQGHTTHLSTADADGMAVSLTQTLGPNMGSKVVTPGLGFLYASTLGGYLSSIEAGVRARSNISPFMVARDGEILLVLGAAGGGMIPPAVVHAVTRVIDFGLSLPEALEEPRVAFGGGGYTAETSADIGWTEEELEEMRGLGLEIVEEPRSGSFGRVHGLQYEPATRTWTGAADPDWEGSARGPDMPRR